MQQIDVEKVRGDARRAVKEFLNTRIGGAWQRLAPTLYIRRDGGGLNLWVRGDHAGGEGMFFVPAYELPALAEIFSVLAAEHVERYKGLYEPGLPQTDQKEIKRLENPGKSKTAE